MKVIGIQERSGVYEGREYDNVIFHIVTSFESGKGVGEQSKTIKVKRSVLEENFDKRLTGKDLESIVSQEIAVFYNEYGAVTVVDILES